MTAITIIGLLGLFIATMFALVNFLPTMLTKWRASTLGLNLTYGQAKIITSSYCNKKDFLADVKEIWFWTDIPIDKLTTHFLAKGDLKNLRDRIIEMKQKNQNIDFSTLSSFDLAGRDLKVEIKKAETRNWVFELTTE
jgi:uncharacterized protein YqfA (UPF0365 family)